MPSEKKLPSFIPPMLARSGEPFDSEDHLFEIKWDGTRALAFVERGACRLLNRRRLEISERYPELSFLPKLDAGTILDGEIVVLRDGKPDFDLLLSREHAGSSLRSLREVATISGASSSPPKKKESSTASAKWAPASTARSASNSIESCERGRALDR